MKTLNNDSGKVEQRINGAGPVYNKTPYLKFSTIRNIFSKYYLIYFKLYTTPNIHTYTCIYSLP